MDFKSSILYDLGISFLMKITSHSRNDIVRISDEIFRHVEGVERSVSIMAIDSIIKNISEQYFFIDVHQVFIILLNKEEVQIIHNIDPLDSIKDFIGWLYVYDIYTTEKGIDKEPLINYLENRIGGY